MDFLNKDDLIIKEVIKLLSSLTTPGISKNEPPKEQVFGVDNVLEYNLSFVLNSDVFKCLQQVHDSEGKYGIKDSNNQSRWNFVRTCLFLMDIVCDVICRTRDEKSKILSVAQKKMLETTFQFIISLAVLPYLLPGVGISLEKKCLHFACVQTEKLSDFVKYRRLRFTINVLLNLYSVDVFKEIIVSKHLEDVLAALFQLSFVPFKKPARDDSGEAAVLHLESLEDDYEMDKMTYALWTKLENDRKRFRNELEKLHCHLYRPLVVRIYMIFLGSKKTPLWMRRNLTNMLTKLIPEENGVLGTIKGIIEINNESCGTLPSQCTIVAKLIAAIFCSGKEEKMRSLSLQLQKLLLNDKRQTYDYILIDVIALTVREMLQGNEKCTKAYLLDAIFNPLRHIDSCDEEEINQAILQIYNLCIVPSNDTIAVPVQMIAAVFPILCFIYAHIKDTVCHLKSPIKELLGRSTVEADGDTLSQLLDATIFGERTSREMVQLPTNKRPVLSSNGGINIVDSDEHISQLEIGLTLLQLIKEQETNHNVISALFVYLLKKYISYCSNEDSSTKNLTIVFLLVQLCQDSSTLSHILKNAENIIQFVRELLNIHTENADENSEVVRICLTFLTMVLYDSRNKKNTNWEIFSQLVPSLKKLKKSSLPDVTLLAEEVYNLILTRNVIGGAASEKVNESVPLIQEIPQSPCEKHIQNACDTLLPVRAHALMELIALIKNGDVETLAKTEKIFCVFEENLKDKDSFLYLRAIEGLASLALLKPSSVLPLLCQEFISCSTAETRLKIGEILTRTVKLLNDFILPYKHLLINTFLNGIKDEDSLVRASSLSNLGELCFALQSNIEDTVYEVIQCAEAVSLSDKNVEPRRAAIFLISSLLRGLKSTIFRVLESNLLDLYRTLKRINSNDADEVVRIQAEISLGILHNVVQDSLVTKPLMEKKIKVFNP